MEVKAVESLLNMVLFLYKSFLLDKVPYILTSRKRQMRTLHKLSLLLVLAASLLHPASLTRNQKILKTAPLAGTIITAWRQIIQEMPKLQRIWAILTQFSFRIYTPQVCDSIIMLAVHDPDPLQATGSPSLVPSTGTSRLKRTNRISVQVAPHIRNMSWPSVGSTAPPLGPSANPPKTGTQVSWSLVPLFAFFLLTCFSQELPVHVTDVSTPLGWRGG